MKGHIFIGWCGNNSLAVMVGSVLESKGYNCVIGGNYNQDDDAFIGGTIIRQLKKCNQTIFLMSKNESGYISNNLTFEIGYSFSKYNSTTKKTHLFYIDIDPKDSCIPSDLLGAWAVHINTSGKSKEDIANEIALNFINNQKNNLKENKMELINSCYSLDEMIASHYSNPQFSDYELAQYLLFYAVGAGLLDNFRMIENNLKLLKKNVDEESVELYQSLKLAEVMHDVALSNIRKDMKSYITDSTYLDAVLKLKKIISFMEAYDSTGIEKGRVVDYEFKHWFLMIGYQRWGYINMMFANNPDITKEECDQAYKDAITYSEKAIELCKVLKESDSKNNKELCVQYKAFCDRNISIAYKYFQDYEKEKIYKLRSFESHKILHDYYENLNLDNHLWDRFERGYYLMMAETIKFIDDPMIKKVYVKKIKAYTEYMLTVRDSSNMYVNRIKLMLESQETDGL